MALNATAVATAAKPLPESEWQPDDESRSCTSCGKLFSMTRRRVRVACSLLHRCGVPPRVEVAQVLSARVMLPPCVTPVLVAPSPAAPLPKLWKVDVP